MLIYYATCCINSGYYRIVVFSDFNKRVPENTFIIILLSGFTFSIVLFLSSPPNSTCFRNRRRVSPESAIPTAKSLN